jgi:dUTP pyrophosphatase
MNSELPIDEKIKIQLINENAKMPTKATSGSSGYDLYSPDDFSIIPKETHRFLRQEGENRVLIPLGFKLSIPKGYEVQIRPRSGLALKYGVTVLNSPGTIDSDYRGEVGVILVNHSAEIYEIKRGDRIAQMVIAKLPNLELEEVDDLDLTYRADGGYGHSGR